MTQRTDDTSLTLFVMAPSRARPVSPDLFLDGKVPYPDRLRSWRSLVTAQRPLVVAGAARENAGPAPPTTRTHGLEFVEDVFLLLLVIAMVPAVILLLASPLMVMRHLASLVGRHL